MYAHTFCEYDVYEFILENDEVSLYSEARLKDLKRKLEEEAKPCSKKSNGTR